MREKLAAARLRLVRGRPYLATALWALQPVETELVPHIAVDARWRLYYNPRWVVGQDVQELEGVLYHEVLHLLRDHASRARAMNAEMQRFNIAADMEINDDIRGEGVPLPGCAVYPETYKLPCGLLAEEYYHKLPDELGAGGVTGGACGSCAHGRSESWEEPGGDGLGPAEAELVRRKVANDITEAARKARGDVPGHLERWAQHKLRAKVDWRRVLAGMVRAAVSYVAGAVDYTYTRPSRRSSAVRGVVLPALRCPTPEVAVVADTSASMSDDELGRVLAEVDGILKHVGLTGATVLATDTTVHTCKRVFDTSQVRLVGGGGTAMGVGIAHALKLRPRPQVVVVLTDGYTLWPETPPAARVIVGLIGDGPEGPPWARTIRIGEEGT